MPPAFCFYHLEIERRLVFAGVLNYQSCNGDARSASGKTTHFEAELDQSIRVRADHEIFSVDS